MSDIKQSDWAVEFDVDYTHRTFVVTRVLNVEGLEYPRHYNPHTFVRAADELGAFGAGVNTMLNLGFTAAR